MRNCPRKRSGRRSPERKPLAKSTLSRSFAKSAMWKLIGIVSLVGVSWAVGMPALQIGKVTIGYHVLTWVLYLLHERVWDRVSWGRFL